MNSELYLSITDFLSSLKCIFFSMQSKPYSEKDDHRFPQIAKGAYRYKHSVCKDSDELLWIWADLLQIVLGLLCLGEGEKCWAHAKAHKEASHSQGDHMYQSGQDCFYLCLCPCVIINIILFHSQESPSKKINYSAPINYSCYQESSSGRCSELSAISRTANSWIWTDFDNECISSKSEDYTKHMMEENTILIIIIFLLQPKKSIKWKKVTWRMHRKGKQLWLGSNSFFD